MTLQALIQQIKQEYNINSIAQTRYSALNKIAEFLSLLEKQNETISAQDILKGIEKKEFNLLYSRYKIAYLQLSEKLSGAEKQAINDLYKKIDGAAAPVIYSEKQLEDNVSVDSAKDNYKKDHAVFNSKTGLAPMVGEEPKILILGTMPSDMSIKKQAYYSNVSHNKFREIMYSIYSNDSNLPYEELLKKHHIALWDCVKSGTRKGSADDGFATDSLIPNDLETFLAKYPTIRVIILNGKSKSRKSTLGIFNKFFSTLNDRYKVIALDSTSNTNTTVSTEEKIKEWAIIKDFE